MPPWKHSSARLSPRVPSSNRAAPSLKRLASPAAVHRTGLLFQRWARRYSPAAWAGEGTPVRVPLGLPKIINSHSHGALDQAVSSMLDEFTPAKPVYKLRVLVRQKCGTNARAR